MLKTVGDDRTPVMFRNAFTGTHGAVTITGTTAFWYSRIGDPISITAPKGAPTPWG